MEQLRGGVAGWQPAAVDQSRLAVAVWADALPKHLSRMSIIDEKRGRRQRGKSSAAMMIWRAQSWST